MPDERIERYPALAMVRLVEWYKPHATPKMLAEKYFIYFGEIPNALGHAVYAGESGKVYPGYHLENFELIPEEDL